MKLPFVILFVVYFFSLSHQGVSGTSCCKHIRVEGPEGHYEVDKYVGTTFKYDGNHVYSTVGSFDAWLMLKQRGSWFGWTICTDAQGNNCPLRSQMDYWKYNTRFWCPSDETHRWEYFEEANGNSRSWLTVSSVQATSVVRIRITCTSHQHRATQEAKDMRSQHCTEGWRRHVYAVAVKNSSARHGLCHYSTCCRAYLLLLLVSYCIGLSLADDVSHNATNTF